MMGASVRNTDVSTFQKGIREAFKDAFDLILPYRCAICGNASDTEDRFTGYNRLYKDIYGVDPELHICGKCLSSFNILEEDKRWSLCLSDPRENDACPGLALYMPFTYQGIAGRAVPRIKFGKKKELARFLGCLLGSCIYGEDIRADLMVPVPLSPERLAERGFNQAEEIAYPASRLNDIPFADDLLTRIKDTKRQSELRDNTVRSKNVAGAFGVSGLWDVTGMTIVIVDDVVTTGATLHEAAEALYKAGAYKVLCIAFAGNRYIKNAEPF